MEIIIDIIRAPTQNLKIPRTKTFVNLLHTREKLDQMVAEGGREWGSETEEKRIVKWAVKKIELNRIGPPSGVSASSSSKDICSERRSSETWRNVNEGREHKATGAHGACACIPERGDNLREKSRSSPGNAEETGSPISRDGNTPTTAIA